MSSRMLRVGPRERLCQDPILDESGELSLENAPQPLSSTVPRDFFARPTLAEIASFFYQ